MFVVITAIGLAFNLTPTAFLGPTQGYEISEGPATSSLETKQTMTEYPGDRFGDSPMWPRHNARAL